MAGRTVAIGDFARQLSQADEIACGDRMAIAQDDAQQRAEAIAESALHAPWQFRQQRHRRDPQPGRPMARALWWVRDDDGRLAHAAILNGA